MKAAIEWTTGVLRVGPELDGVGSPYEFAATLIRRGDRVEIIGAAGSFDRRMWKAIKDALNAEGISTATFDRYHDNHHRTEEAT